MHISEAKSLVIAWKEIVSQASATDLDKKMCAMMVILDDFESRIKALEDG
jgi:hypothetical protein